jgi:hypothetical protein
MRRMLLTAVAIAAFISGAVLLHHAAAAAKAHAAPLADAGTADTGLVQLAMNLCGNNGCVAVQVKRLDKHQLQKPVPKNLPQGLQQTQPQAQQQTLPQTTQQTLPQSIQNALARIGL